MFEQDTEISLVAALYVRVSEDDGVQEKDNSVLDQKRILENYVKEHGISNYRFFIDDGASGENFDRPAVQRLLEEAKNGRINTIIVKDLDRFGENRTEVGQYTDYIFPMYDIRFISLRDNFDSANRKLPIVDVLNEWNAASVSRKIRASIESNAKAGKYRTNFAPYGYVKGDDEHHLPVRDEPAASYVRRMFEMRASGMSPNKIAGIYNDEGIKPPADYKEEKFGIPNTRRSHHLWSGMTVKQILTNPIYIGNLVQLRTTSHNKKTVKRAPEDVVIVRGTHEPLVSRELWDKCREMEAAVSRREKAKAGEVFPLTGLAYCADCGSKMHLGQNSEGSLCKHHYNCGSFNRFGERSCESHYIKMDELSSFVFDDICSKLMLIETDEGQAREVFMKRGNTSADTDEFIRRLKTYAQASELTREMCSELIEFVTVDKYPGRSSRAQRGIRIIYKFIDNTPLPEKKYIDKTN